MTQSAYVEQCPFCRYAKPELRQQRHDLYQVACPSCGAGGPTCANAEVTISEWNDVSDALNPANRDPDWG